MARARPKRGLLSPALAAVLTACSGESGTDPQPGPLAGRAFVVNSLAGTLSIVGLTADGELEAQNDVVELGAGANAVTLAVGEGVVAVPTQTSRLLVFDEATLARRCSAALPPGSSPQGVAIAGGDAFVTLLVSGELARVDLATCEVEQVGPVGASPADVEVLGETLLVVVGNIDLSTGANPPPRIGESYVAFVDALTLEVRDTVGTGGFNAQFAALDRTGDLLVVNTGDFGQRNSSLVVLDPIARRRRSGPVPIGDSAADLAVGPDNLAYVTSFSDGLYAFDATAGRVLRGPANPLSADSAGLHRGSSGVAVDRAGNVLSVYFGDFVTPGKVFLFDAGQTLSDSVRVGVGPFGAAFETSARPR
ncbi:MAG: hypothetical protein ABR599_01535 [Gemmatimonadota bacterium]